MGGVLGIFDTIGEGLLAVLVGWEIASRTTELAYFLRAVLGGALLGAVAGIGAMGGEAATGTVSKGEALWMPLGGLLGVGFFGCILYVLALHLDSQEESEKSETRK
jgi:hypothetical protein